MGFSNPFYGVIVQGALTLPRCDLAATVPPNERVYENTGLAIVNCAVRGARFAAGERGGGFVLGGRRDKYQCGRRFLSAVGTLRDVGGCGFLRTLFSSDACSCGLAALYIWALGIYGCGVVLDE